MPNCDEWSGGAIFHRRDPTLATASTVTLRYHRIAADSDAARRTPCSAGRAASRSTARGTPRYTGELMLPLAPARTIREPDRAERSGVHGAAVLSATVRRP